MTSTNCLNCEKELTDNFCSGCGQKTDIHRITIKNFIFHDILHGTFHIEKGMLFTAKEALLRPGKAALDYISGKRKRYYNVFYLVLIILAVILFLGHVFEQLEDLLGREILPEPPFRNEASRKLDKILDQSKIIICLFVPFGALNSAVLFRRNRLNFAEHAIISGMVLLGMLLIVMIANLLFYFDLVIQFNNTFAAVYGNTVITLVLLHIGYGYYNAFGRHYSKWGFAYRIALFFAMICLEALSLLFFAIGFVTNWQFYTVNIVNLFG